ncbi:aldehyde dehydrogenase family protein [Actinoplanes couchii]|uniref:Aldehyde dehydrogenase n=1 Tax=Actinoplanes couchii TaxID=403638 RepID=A0ABQ3XL36_9ACTN|nr:aldehyde dehydrogenase family protein [Actinoplanes couchii]MDR6318417.1 aldehyde dehydrogenase (NAD+) [Actinoplanes couchii]GID59217.1 aldehyde dehydrogenase [Actinoplanes couchii]
MIDVIDPATGEVAGRAPDTTREQLDAVVAAARAAQPGWAARTVDERRGYLRAIADVVEANTGELARLVTREQGKPLPVAVAEVAGLAYWLRETATLDLPETVNQDDGERLSITRHVPLGVVAAITPWNYPIGQLSFKISPALLAGNTVVVKPSTFTPLSTLRLGELLGDVLPQGILTVVTGGDDLGPWLTAHPGIDKISFTGSTVTGRAVMAGAGASLTRVTLELGGNDPAIVLPDVDPEEVAEQLFWAAFGNAGQICLASKRIYLHTAVYDRVAARMVELAEQVKIGNGLDDGVQLGPISNTRQYGTVLDLYRDAVDSGYDILTGGPLDGLFFRPTLIGNPPDDARIVREEQFGLVLPLLRFDDVDEVIARANTSEYALGASVWSADPEAARAVAERLDAGTVWVNEVMHLSPLVPFGGSKQSGIGVESGQAGLLAFTERRTLTVKRR